jgi:hypothetical protein
VFLMNPHSSITYVLSVIKVDAEAGAVPVVTSAPVVASNAAPATVLRSFFMLIMSVLISMCVGVCVLSWKRSQFGHVHDRRLPNGGPRNSGLPAC